MIEVIREYTVKETTRSQFQLTFGRGGAWSKLLSRRPGFRGIVLLRDLMKPLHYLTVELWDSEDHWNRTLSECGDEFAELEISLSDWVESKMELGTYRMLSEGSVQPFGKSRRRN